MIKLPLAQANVKNVFAFMLCLALGGCSIRDPRQSSSEATAFADSTLTQYAADWNANTIQKVMDTRIDPKDIQDLSAKFGRTLGPLKKLSGLKMEKSSTNVNIGMNNSIDFAADYTARLECQKDVASAKISVVHENDKWRVVGFDINSPLLDKADEKPITAAMKYVDSIAPIIFAGTDLNFIEKNADPGMLQALRVNSMLSLAVLNLPKTFGKYNSYDGAKYITVMKDHSRDIYQFNCSATYEKSKGLLFVGVVKDPAGWKIRHMNLTGGVIKLNDLVK